MLKHRITFGEGEIKAEEGSFVRRGSALNGLRVNGRAQDDTMSRRRRSTQAGCRRYNMNATTCRAEARRYQAKSKKRRDRSSAEADSR